MAKLIWKFRDMPEITGSLKSKEELSKLINEINRLDRSEITEFTFSDLFKKTIYTRTDNLEYIIIEED